MTVQLKDFVSPLSAAQVDFWLSQFHFEHYPAQCNLFYRRHYPHGAYIMIEGGIRLEFKQQRKTTYAYINQPAIIGVPHVLHHSKLAASVRTTAPSKLIFVPRAALVDKLHLEKNVA